jgi:ADP-heptose:LPS heptosyltransferase
MKKALFISKNLIGDALFASPVLRKWHKQNPDFEITLQTLPDFISDVYKHFGVPLNVVFDANPAEFDFVHTFDIGKAFSMGDELKIHAVEAYENCLFGSFEKSQEKARDIKPVYIPEEEEHERGLILISPFSRSCSSNEKGKAPNKMIPWPHWLQIVTLLRSYGSIGVLGGESDRCPLPIAEDEYFTGLPLNHVALLLRDAKLFVTIDNGMAHLASSQETKTIEFYPSCLGMHWAAPLGNPNIYLIHTDPAVISVGQAVYAVRQGISALLLGR